MSVFLGYPSESIIKWIKEHTPEPQKDVFKFQPKRLEVYIEGEDQRLLHESTDEIGFKYLCTRHNEFGTEVDSEIYVNDEWQLALSINE